MLNVSDLHIAFGELDLLYIENWTLHPKQKIALVGANGTGKSSFLRVVLQEELPMGGTVSLRPKTRIGYLPQKAVSGSTKPLWAEVKSGMSKIIALESELEDIQNRLEQGDQLEDQLINKMEEFRIAGGYNQTETIGITLHGLGFQQEDWEKSCAYFSGGWQMRIALAKLLLSEPDLAILDEPTNHLDYQAKEWLSNHLSNVEYAVFIVSHDGTFLDRFCSHTIEIRNKALHSYTGDYSAFLRQRGERQIHEQLAYEKQQSKIQHLQSYIDRFGAKATKAKQAQSRKKQLDKIDRINAPQSTDLRSSLRFKEAPSSDFLLYELQNATIGWQKESPLLRNVNLRLEQGMRLVLVGANGSGKSTLLKTLLGKVPLLSGNRLVGNRIRLGLYSQDLAQQLPMDQTPLSYIHDSCPASKESEIRRALGSLGLASTAHNRQIELLSGGEKARVVLAELSLAGYNTLFLDEPTNHLDTASGDGLAKALASFEGAILFISHDKKLIERAATHVGQLQDDTLTIHLGYDEKYLEFTLSKVQVEAKTESALSYKEQQKERNLRRKTKREYDDIEERISQLEELIEGYDAQMFEAGNDLKAIQKLQNDKNSSEEELERAMERWEVLEEEIAKFEE